MVIHEVLPDRDRVATAAQGLSDQLPIGRTRVDTSSEIVGFGGPSPGRPRLRTGMPAARRYSPTVTRWTPVALPMRLSVQPNRPSVRTCCCLCCSKALLIRAKNYTSLALVNVPAGSVNCRFCGVDQLSVLGVHRGAATTRSTHPRLKKLLADALLENKVTREVLRKKVVTAHATNGPTISCSSIFLRRIVGSMFMRVNSKCAHQVRPPPSPIRGSKE